MNAIVLYCKMIGVSIRGQLQYRASFVMFTLGNALGAFIEYLGVWAFFGRFGALGSWTLAEAGIFYGMAGISFALCEAFTREFDTFQNSVRSGSFDRLLLRPRSTVLQMLGAQCQIMRVGRLLQGILVLVLGLTALRLPWNLSHWVLLLFSIVGGAFLFSGIIVLQATSCFWTVESLEVWNSITYGGVTVTEYPLSVYPRPLRFFFTFLVPLAAMNYWPCSFLLMRHYVSPWLSWLSPGIGVLVFVISLGIWHMGVRHYRSTGS